MPPVIRDVIRRMKGYSPPKEGRTGLRLDFNENTVGCSPNVLEALRHATAEDLARYPEYNQAEAEIAAAFGHTPATCTITNGVDDAIFLAALTFLDQGDEAIVVEPTFSMYRFYASQLAAEVRRVEWRERELQPGVREFYFVKEDVLAAVTPRTRIIFIASPNNPTGTLAAREDLLALAAALPDVALFVDEAYADFVSEGNRGLLDEVVNIPNLLVARTFSKAYGLAGARLGCLFANQELMRTLRKAHSPYNVNTLAVICGRAAVRDREWVQEFRRQAIASRRLIEKRFLQMGIIWWKSAANFVLFQAGEAADFLLEGMRAHNILIRDRRSDYPGTLRITSGTVEQTQHALDTFAELWGEYQRRGAATPKAADTRPVLAFDMDGVLVDVHDSYRRAIMETVRALGGGEVTPAEVQALKNEGGYNNDWDLSQELLRRRGIDVAYGHVVDVFTGFYQGKNWDGLILTERWLLPLDLLEQLRRQYRLAIFTGRPQADANFVLRRFNVEYAFERVIALEDVANGKPDPEGLVKVAQVMAPSPVIAYIGDTIDDGRCAHAAGVPFIGVLPQSHLSHQELQTLFQTLGASTVVEDVAAAARHLLAAAQPVPAGIPGNCS